MLLKAGLISLALLLASRVLGVLRESAQAAAFGASATGDVVVLMLMLPDWLAGLVAGGALAYVLLPHWARQGAAGVKASQRRVALGLLGVGIVLAVVAAALAAPLAGLLVPGLSQARSPQAVEGLRWSVLALPAALLAALWAARLQHERDFTGMYGANLVINGVLIAALLWLAAAHGQGDAVMFMGLALVAAALLRLAWLHWRLRRQPGSALSPADPDPRGDSALPPGSLWLWAILSAGLPLALPFVARSLASQSGEGALATFNYAWKLVELPLILAIQLAASLAFPLITRVFASGDDPAPALRRAFALTWLLACAAAAGLLVGAPAAAALLFGWGRMDAAGLAAVAAWGTVGAWGLLPQALTAVALVVLATQGRLKPVALTYAVALAALLLCSPWARGDGARLMVLLNLVQLGVAGVLLALLGGRVRAWLPGRGMAVAGAALLAVAAGCAAFPGWLAALGLAPRLALAALAAVLLMGAVWLADAPSRAWLRR